MICNLCPRERARERLTRSPVDPLKRSQTLNDGMAVGGKGGPPADVMAGHSLPFCVLCVPALSTPVAFSILRCRQSLPAFGVSQPWTAHLRLFLTHSG